MHWLATKTHCPPPPLTLLFPPNTKSRSPGMPPLHIPSGAPSNEGLKVFSSVPLYGSLYVVTLEAEVSLWLQSNRIFLKVFTCWAFLVGPLSLQRLWLRPSL